jgi:serine/threonine protein kinase/tetratricopeptide (TPR) repeat protein
MLTDGLEALEAVLVDRYRLEGEVGRGGMAIVYRAHDRKHDRKVAIKVLKPELSAVVGTERFLREIQIAAKLTHPHILPLHDSGAAAGLLYYVMPYVQGETLRERLKREHHLPLPDTVRLAGEIAEGLSYAHNLGIIHRDIKPENILLSDGHAVIGDFGIAQAVRVAGEDRFTAKGIAVGTPDYMSPEQASGATVDPRTDIFSLACVVYEVLTGAPPTTGGPRRAIQREVAAVLRKGLAPAPTDRFATVQDFADSLAHAAAARRGLRNQRVGLAALVVLVVVGTAVSVRFGLTRTKGTSPPTLRVGVLPPEVESGGGIDSLVARAPLIQHLIAAELSRYRGLAVADPQSLNSRLEFVSEHSTDPIEALRDWGLGYVVRVTLTPVPNGFTLDYVLTQTRNKEVVQAGSFTNTKESDLPAQIRGIGGRLLEAFETATGGVTKGLDMEPFVERAPNLAAVNEFLQGTEYAFRGMPGARPHFERALQLAPDFIAPRVWMVSGLAQVGDTAAVQVQLRELDKRTSGASPFERALIEWAKATARGDRDARVRHLRVALVYSPRNNVLLYNLGADLFQLGRPVEAVAPIREAIQSGWRFAPLYALWGVLAIQSGQLEGLRDTLEMARSITPSDPYLTGLLEPLAILDGDLAAAQRYQAAFRADLGPSGLAEGLTEMIPIYQALARQAGAAGKARARTILIERVAEAERLRALKRDSS